MEGVVQRPSIGFEVAVVVDDDDLADDDFIGEVLEGYVDNGVVGNDPYVDDLTCELCDVHAGEDCCRSRAP